ncbi:MAG: hypothetical protein KAT74_04715, partial [Candidatus Cloacimonetes bacterium]|nr:hypothetical protein [Candidatus Cloacimonadota bacterium]
EPAWQEEVPPIIFEPNAEDIRQNGVWLFNDPNIDIAYVKIDGSGYTSMVGNIQLAEIKEFTVYSWYPADAAQANEKVYAGNNWFEEADSLWVNHVPIYDTIWTNGPSGSVINHSVFVNDCELWIEGEISGKQTWGCSDTIYIVGDIKYEGTQLGALPDDPGNLNRMDYFGLVSEKKLIIRYKHKDPETGDIIFHNCDDVYMYGAYAAIGKGSEDLYGEMACHHDGIFTFQYQHPHGSTPNFTALSPYTLEETLYTYIDFHKYIYPINNYVPPNIQDFNLHGAPPPDGLPCGYNYEDPFYIATYPDASEGNPYYNYTEPYGTDWPWYNPVWPENRLNIVYERGTLHI